jgi:hypothetical protein
VLCFELLVYLTTFLELYKLYGDEEMTEINPELIRVEEKIVVTFKDYPTATSKDSG